MKPTSSAFVLVCYNSDDELLKLDIFVLFELELEQGVLAPF
jgi:hypothetical protein